MDSTDLGGGEYDVAGLFGGEERLDVRLASEVELGVGPEDEICEAERKKLANNGGAD